MRARRNYLQTRSISGRFDGARILASCGEHRVLASRREPVIAKTERRRWCSMTGFPSWEIAHENLLLHAALRQLLQRELDGLGLV